jgi:hypothetical protein
LSDFDPIVSVTVRRASGATETVLAAIDPDPQPDPKPTWGPLTNQSNVCVNLDFPNSSSTCHAFADALKSARPRGVDTTPDQRIVFVEQVAAGGTYKLYRDGEFKFDVDVAPDLKQTTAWVGDGAKYELIRPGCKRGDLFTPQFLQQLAPFGAIRFMDWLQTNGSKIVQWSDRPTLDSETWERPGYGVPLEVCIALANQTGKDIWLNIPHAADDDYITKFGELVHRTLRPDVNCYVEYGNELVWNTAGVFGVAHKYVLDKVRALKAGGDTQLNEPDGSYNETNACHYWVADRAAEASEIIGHRFKMVLSNQNGYGKLPAQYGWWFKKQLDFLLRVGVDPKTTFHAIASAPYGGINGTDPKPDHRRAIATIAGSWNLQYFGYEVGFHDVDGGQAMNDLHAAPEAFAKQEDYYNNLKASGMDRVWQFVMSSRWTDKYRWGLARGTHDFESPKYKAAVKVAGEWRD